MRSYITPSMPVIDDSNWQQFAQGTLATDGKMGCGLVARDWVKHPQNCFSFASEFPDSLLIPESEWEPRLKEMKEKKACLLDHREQDYDTLKSLYQNGFGLCWQFSGVKASMYLRKMQGLPGKRFSAYWAAGQVKHWADQGGWGSQGLQQLVDKGVPEEKFCPEYNRKYDTPEARENALLYRVTEWWEGSENREKAKKQMISALLLGFPTICDFNHMSHSMCVPHLDDVRNLKTIADNSWGESSGDRGLYALAGSKAIPDGLWIPRVSLPTP